MRGIISIAVGMALSATTAAAQNSPYAKGLIVPADADYGVPFLSFEADDNGDDEIPATYDLRELGLMTPVRNQGGCGSCWAFAGVAAMETALLKQSGGQSLAATDNLSEQELVSCDTSAYGCNGGWQPFDYMVSKGITSEEELPYQARDLRCRATNKVAKALRWGNVGTAGRRATVAEVKKAVVDFGALWITVGANSYWDNPSPVLTRCSNTQINHAVTVAGYETDAAGKTNFIIKNSWGTGWNGDGYVKTPLGCNNLGATVSFVVPENSLCAPPEFGLPKVISLKGRSASLRAPGLEAAGLKYSWEKVSGSKKASGFGPIKALADENADYVVKTKNACGVWTMKTRVIVN